MRGRLWEMEAALEELSPFSAPKTELEQYSTSAHLASQIVFAAATHFGDIAEKTVLDLGCGPGMLSLACLYAGADRVLGVDIDEEALDIARVNAAGEEDRVDFVRCDVINGRLPFDRRVADTCVMNPPFGTRLKGSDVAFLKAASQLVETAVYSLHKSSTRDYLLKRAKDMGFPGGAQVVAELSFDLPKSYKFHTQQSTDIRVDLMRFDLHAGGVARPPPLTSHSEEEDRRSGRGHSHRNKNNAQNKKDRQKQRRR